MDVVVPDKIVKLELESSVIKKENVDGLTNIKTERDEDNILSIRIKQELQSPGCGNTENESGEIISTRNIKIERDQAIENQINKILGTTIKEEPDLNDELTTDYMVNLECLPSIKTEELMLKNECEDSEGGAHKKKRRITKDRTKSFKIYNCDQCYYRTCRKDHLERHISVAHKKKLTKRYNCDHCDYSAGRTDHLAIHILVKHNKNSDKKYACDICEYRSHRKTDIKRHKIAKHDNNLVKTQCCHLCEYESHFKRDLKRHILLKHDKSAIKDHCCDLCDYRTHQKNNLKTHISIKHSKNMTKDHACDICDYKTHWKSHLKCHIMFKHNKNPNKEHGCHLCNYRAHWKRSLRRHMLSKHDINSNKEDKLPENEFSATNNGSKPQGLWYKLQKF